MASLCPRPLGRSGCVKTAATSWPALTVCSRLGTAKAGVPINTSFTALLFPLASFLQFSNFAPDQIAFQRTDMADIKLAVEMIGFMQQGAGQQLIACHLKLFALRIPGADRHFQRTHHLFAESGQAQAAFLAFVRAFGL